MLGPFVIVGVVLRASWSDALPPGVDAARDDEALAEAAADVLAWFGGRTAFTVAVAPTGTPFQQRVWASLREIPFGETVTYGGLAHHLRSDGGARAVGAAGAPTRSRS